MGRVLMWLLGVPATVAVLFAMLGGQSIATPTHHKVTIVTPGSSR
jgi:hypothetical protein